MELSLRVFKRNLWLQLFTIFLRYLLGSSFVFASIFKIRGIRFMPKPLEQVPVNTLAHFFEAMFQAGVYWQFIGWGQLITGFLLMSQVFSTTGALAFLPLMLNIFIITLSFESATIQAITATMLIGNFYLLLWDWSKLKFVFLPQPGPYLEDDTAFAKWKGWTYIGLLLFFVVVSYRLFQTQLFLQNV